MATEQRINEIFGTKGKLAEFHTDWNKLLESDSEDEDYIDVTSGLADNLSSTLRCSSDDFEGDVSDVLGDDDSDLFSSQDVALKPENTIVLPGNQTIINPVVVELQIHADEEDFDSGLEFFSSSSSHRVDENNPGSSNNPFANNFQRQWQASPQSKPLQKSNTPKREHKKSVLNNRTSRNTTETGKRTYDDLKNHRTFYNSNYQRQSSATAVATTTDNALFKQPNRPNSRASSVANEPPLKHARYYNASIEFETDQSVIDRRSKQIDYGKNTIGYQNYTKAVPKNKRKRDNPFTPDKYVRYSRRSWDQQVKIWRRRIHEYDPEDAANQCSKRNLDFDSVSDCGQSNIEEQQQQVSNNNNDDDSSKENQQNVINTKMESTSPATTNELDIDISDILDFDL